MRLELNRGKRRKSGVPSFPPMQHGIDFSCARKGRIRCGPDLGPNGDVRSTLARKEDQYLAAGVQHLGKFQPADLNDFLRTVRSPEPQRVSNTENLLLDRNQFWDKNDASGRYREHVGDCKEKTQSKNRIARNFTRAILLGSSRARE